MEKVPPGFQSHPAVYFRCKEIIDDLSEDEGAVIALDDDEPFWLVWYALVQLAQRKHCIAQMTWTDRKEINVFLEGRL